MPIAPRVKHVFDTSTRRRGQTYFNSGHVEITARSGDGVGAIVQGNRGFEYHVLIDWSEPSFGVNVQCDCPHYEGGKFCKHLWATFLQINQEGLGDHLSGKGRLAIDHDIDGAELLHEKYFGEVFIDEDEDQWAASHRGSSTSIVSALLKLGAGSKESSKNWQQQLGYVPQVPDMKPQQHLSAGSERRVLYLLNVADSLRVGNPMIMLNQQIRKKNGEWGKAKPLKLMRKQLAELDSADREIMLLVLGNPTHSSTYHGAYYNATEYNSVAKFQLEPDYYPLLLPKLCATGRFGWVLTSDQRAEERRTLTWDDGPEWQFRIAMQAKPKKKLWELTGAFARGANPEEEVPLAQTVIALESGLVIFPDAVAQFKTHSDNRWLKLLLARQKLEVPYTDRGKLLGELWATPSPPEVQWPANLQPQVADVRPTGYLKINAAERRHYSYKPRYLQGQIGFDYGGQRLSMNSSLRLIEMSEGDQVVIRSGEQERLLLKEAEQQGVESYRDPYYEHAEENIRIARSELATVAHKLLELGWHVEAEGATLRTAGDFNISVTSGVDWFDLESDLDFGEASADVPALLAAVKSDDGYVTLSDGSRGLLPEQWLERFAPLAELAEVHEEKLRFRPSQAMLLDALLAERQEEAGVQLDQQFRQFRKKLSSFAGVEPRNAPRGFHGELRDYQRAGLGWLKFLQDFNLGGCLADDMGLGKTVQVLALLQQRRARRLKNNERRLPSLVVAPKSVAGNWVAEAEKFAPRLKVLSYIGNQRRQFDEQLDETDLIVTTYGTLRRDIEQLSQRDFDYAILDESQAIKNDKSQSAKACRLLQAQHRLALTGTPIENHLGELWSQFEFLNPGMLGRSSAFRNFARAGKETDEATRQQSQELLKKAIAPFLLRRTKEEVLDDLPPKQEQSLSCTLLPADRKRYDELRKHYRDSLLKRIDTGGMNKSKMHVLEALLRLRQAACHPGLIDKKLAKKPSAKLDLLLEQLTEVIAGGHKALVFSQFTSMLSIVRDRLDKQKVTYEYLDGKTRNRQERVERFQSDEDCPVFLISLKAGGTGLNLTAADYVFVLDPWWNPAVESQAIDRAHRIGQERNVFAYRLIAKDTVEEKILELQQQKRDLADAIINANESLLQSMTSEDLRQLLS